MCILGVLGLGIAFGLRAAFFEEGLGVPLGLVLLVGVAGARVDDPAAVRSTGVRGAWMCLPSCGWPALPTIVS